MRQLTLDVRAEPEPSLDNFVVGANAQVLERLRALACDPASAALYLWGPQHGGRSHLLRSTVAAARAAGQEAMYLEAAAVGTELPLAPGGLLAIDDVDVLGEAGQVALFRAFNDMAGARIRLLASGPCAPRHLALREDLRTRLGAALVFELHPLGEEDAARSMERHAAARGLRLAPEIVPYLLRRGRRDLPFLMAALDALDELSLTRQRPITLAMARELFDSQPDREATPKRSCPPAALDPKPPSDPDIP
ncbi:MAG: DnaA regulatory inactivator Hda [Betaproteobacteria bacterium]|nr:DnaA regulatory inactivator Hda [Betaproteobacteria bacterium]